MEKIECPECGEEHTLGRHHCPYMEANGREQYGCFCCGECMGRCEDDLEDWVLI